jgi:hypothetical protein
MAVLIEYLTHVHKYMAKMYLATCLHDEEFEIYIFHVTGDMTLTFCPRIVKIKNGIEYFNWNCVYYSLIILKFLKVFELLY